MQSGQRLAGLLPGTAWARSCRSGMMMAGKGDRMHPRRPHGDAVSRLRVPLRLAALVAAITLTTAGCGHAAAKTTASHPATHCGSARTVANVPVKVEVTRGKVACPAALTVERSYTKAIAAGKAPGNGGGGPVNISGWMCQGFPTPQVLKTGWASKCVRGGTEILAVLPPP
jgi:hypothetical protein